MDYKRPLDGHPIVELLLSALSAADKAYPQGDILRLVKTGLLDISQDEAEEFENYVLRWGIKGSMFASPFTRGEVSENVERARLTVMEPLETLRKGIINGVSAKTMAEAVYAYLERINLFDKLESIVERLREQGKFALMEENAQIWNILMELLDQLHALLGEQSGRKLFIEALEAGIKSYDVGVIPSTLDQVTIGDIERTKRRAVRALFVMGCNAGILPGTHRDDELINDAELGRLTQLGLAPWQGSAYVAENEYVSIYLSLAKPTERLMLSFALTAGGRELTPSGLIDTIRKRFSHIETENDITLSERRRRDWLGGARAGDKLLIRSARAAIDGGGYDPLAGEVWAHLNAADEGRAKLEKVRGALLFDGLQAPMGAVTAKKLYGASLISSASRLETYAQCPFRHFMRYGLRRCHGASMPRRRPSVAHLSTTRSTRSRAR
jgi:ATP-dependent helicase/nuclease subunit B